MAKVDVDQIGSYLRQGQARKALDAARQLCAEKGNGRETGIAIAKSAASVYRDLIAPPVHEFAEGAPSVIDGEAGPLVQKALQRLIRQTEEWEVRLWEVHSERLAREIRDWTRLGHFDAVCANIGRLMALVPSEKRRQRAGYIGGTLATVINNQKEARQVLKKLAHNAAQWHVEREEVVEMDRVRAARFDKIGSMDIDNIEREYSSTLTDAVVQIQRILPEPNQMGEPDETILREVGDTFRSILRVPIWREEPDLFLDATKVLVDFVPKEQSATAKLAKVEGRVYNQLGFQAKKAVLLTFQDIGRNNFFAGIYKAWAADYAGTDALREIIELMGALRSKEFNDFLKIVRADTKVSKSVHNQMSQALGSIADEEAADELLAQLRGILGKRRIESSEMREAEQVVTSLGQIVKSPRTGDEDRNRIWEFLRTHVPEDLSKLALHTALAVFTAKRESQTKPQRQWAIRVLVRSLWLPEETTEHHKGGERQTSIMGFREKVVEALEKLAPGEMDTLLHAMEPLVARFSMGFVAAAELFAKLKEPAALVLLERMLNTALMHDENSGTAYQRDYYWDTATQERKPLTKKEVIPPLVYAIGVTEDDKSKEILKRYQGMIASGRVSPPDGETAQHLERFLGDAAFAKKSGETAAGGEMPPEEVKELLKQLRAGYLLSGKQKRRAKKIEALTRLAQATPVDALDEVFLHLADKDSLVASAAITCLTEYALPDKPKTHRDLTVNGALDLLESKDPAMREGAAKLLREIGPNRKDVKDKIVAFAKQVESLEAKDALARALRASAGSETLSAMASALEGEEPPGSKANTASATHVGKLELKREYMQARKEWIAGGKKGEPPLRPEGID